MQIREYTEADLGELRKLHAESGFRYDLPNFSSESFFSRHVVSDSQVRMAGFLRLTAEAYLICDPNWRTAAWRELALRNLQNSCRRDAANKGVCEVNAFIPPNVEKKFRSRLLRLGWKRYIGDEWKAYSFEV